MSTSAMRSRAAGLMPADLGLGEVPGSSFAPLDSVLKGLKCKDGGHEAQPIVRSRGRPISV